MSRLRLMFSISTVASSTSMPMARASPPSVIKLSVCPVSLSPRMPIKIAMGIEVQTTIVLRQLPTKARIIKATKTRGDGRLSQDASHRSSHEARLIEVET